MLYGRRQCPIRGIIIVMSSVDRGWVGAKMLVVAVLAQAVAGFHDCIQHRSHSHGKVDGWGERSERGESGRVDGEGIQTSTTPCAGGLCVGMHNGPHEGGPASYPVGDRTAGYTSVYSTMTVPELPKKQDGICYYIWSDAMPCLTPKYAHCSIFYPSQVVATGPCLVPPSPPPQYPRACCRFAHPRCPPLGIGPTSSSATWGLAR
jgi:hypothetical protein